MTGRLFAAVIAAALIIPAQSRAAPAPSDEAIHAVMAAVVDDVIVPGYAAFHESAEALDNAADRLCADASPQSLDAARATFSGTVSAWGRIEMIHFGPAMDENRLERVLFYPDPRGIGLRQVQEILATEDETATKTETLAHKSVAAQGLGALEYVLFGTGSTPLPRLGTRSDAATPRRSPQTWRQSAANWRRRGPTRRALPPNGRTPSTPRLRTHAST